MVLVGGIVMHDNIDLYIECISIITSIGALILSIFAYRNSQATGHAQVELEMRTLISNAQNRMQDIALKIAESSGKVPPLFQSVMNAAMEQVANAYDEACDKYLDKKIDLKSFENLYRNEIIQLVENEQFRPLYDTATTRYKATRGVYDAWTKRK